MLGELIPVSEESLLEGDEWKKPFEAGLRIPS